MVERWPIVIVGGGPAGTATALFLVRRRPELASEILILDKAIHPRFKVCAGGLIPHTIGCLEELGIALEIPHVPVSRAFALTPAGTVEHNERRGFCTVVRRDCFDALLVDSCVRRGVTVRQGEKVLDVVEHAEFVEVKTERQNYRASVVVGADGSGSLVRRRVFGHDDRTIGRAIMADVSALDLHWAFPNDPWCKFDFRPAAEGLRGYAWMFPCSIDGTPHWNVGVYSSQAKAQGCRMNGLLEKALSRIGARAVRSCAYPVRLFHSRTRLATSRVLLVGDAAGVDPLMGEGISFAFEYGRLAAECIAAWREPGSDGVAAYERMVRESWLGRKLRRLNMLERMFYGRTSKFWFWFAVSSERARRVGLRWYSGQDGWDQLSLPRGLARLGQEAMSLMRGLL